MNRFRIAASAAAIAAMSAPSVFAQNDPFGAAVGTEVFEGAVYAMSNDTDGNTVVGYGRRDDGSLVLLGEFASGGVGGIFDGGEGIDPLLSQYSVLLSEDRQFLFTVNAGSSSVSSFRIETDLSLTLLDTESVAGVGPNSLAYRDGILYAASIDDDGVDVGAAAGVISGLTVAADGSLEPIGESTRELGVRPAAIRFSPDGRFLVVSSLTAGISGLPDNQVTVYGVDRFGLVSDEPLDTAISLSPGRPLPGGFGFEFVTSGADQYVIVSEVRAIAQDGRLLDNFELPAGSVSVWRIERDGRLVQTVGDLELGRGRDIQRAACWVEISPDGETVFVVNTADSTISALAFDDGHLRLVDQRAASGSPELGNPEDRREREIALRRGLSDPFEGVSPFEGTDGFIDLVLSDDGRYLYQLAGFRGAVRTYEVLDRGGLRFLGEVEGTLPVTNTQGIDAF